MPPKLLSLFGTRVVYDWIQAKRWLKNLSFFQLFHKPNLDFIAWRRYAFGVSIALSLIGIFAFVQMSRGHGNLGVEFSAGAMVRLDAKQAFTVAERVRKALDAEGWGHAEIQPLEGGRGLMVKVKKSEESVGQMADKLAVILNKSLPQSQFTVVGTEEIGASISKDLRQKAIIAIVNFSFGHRRLHLVTLRVDLQGLAAGRCPAALDQEKTGTPLPRSGRAHRRTLDCD